MCQAYVFNSHKTLWCGYYQFFLISEGMETERIELLELLELSGSDSRL